MMTWDLGETASAEEVMTSLLELVDTGLVFVRRADEGQPTLSRDTLIQDLARQDGAEHWFALTSAGSLEWERHHEAFSGAPVDWSGSYRASVNDIDRSGVVEGASRDVCLKVIRSYERSSEEIAVDWDSLVERPIKEFRARYHRTLANGYRIKFSLK